MYLRGVCDTVVFNMFDSRRSHTPRLINLPTLSASSIMLKREGDATRIRATKVKKRRGVGSRTITVLDSDEEGLPRMASKEYARMTKTRVGASGKVERVVIGSVAIFEKPNTPTPVEENAGDPVDVVAVESVVQAVPAKRQKRVNDSVSRPNWIDHFILLTTLQTKMHSWLTIQSTVLDEIVSLDGPDNHRLDFCSSCSDNRSPLYRCLECCYSSLHCSGCVVNLHKKLPLHRLEVGSFIYLVRECHPTHIMHSAGKTGSLTGTPSIRSDLSATLGIMWARVLESLYPTTSPSST